MTSDLHLPYPFLLYITTLLLYLVHLLSPTFSLSPHHLPDSTRGLLFEEKTQLGSTPPSCHNKCNECHPCLAVQIPTLPGQNLFQPGSDRFIPKKYESPPSSPSSSSSDEGNINNRFSNYKPLGWKCSCENRFYNP
ncbi:hypothetical protein RJ641_009979 [Dillenia turbinata]|uniref:Epidermal patterning factor-like protein n=1 Tax=Dillenia turbinata TaxID=194707 RepID=A0AAN8V2P1_9MAGN